MANKVTLLPSNLNLQACQSLIFKNPKELIQQCRVLDQPIDGFTKRLDDLAIKKITTKDMAVIFSELASIDAELNGLKKIYRDLFTGHIINQDFKEWLHLEYAVTRSPKSLRSARLRWRLGMASEKRYYCDIEMLRSKHFIHFFNHESKVNQQIILECERIRVRFLGLTKQIRHIYIDCELTLEIRASIQLLQSQYHASKESAL